MINSFSIGTTFVIFECFFKSQKISMFLEVLAMDENVYRK